jgi:EAL domain-containing protein (putative c-di-GMP-specific phosphodiesterase class I)
MRWVPASESSVTRLQLGATGDRQTLAAIEADICVAVNVSARTIGRLSFADYVFTLLDEAGVPGERLIIEVTKPCCSPTRSAPPASSRRS